jgi:CRISPR-associated protein Cmx8
LPQEGALALMDHLARLTQQNLEEGELRFSIRFAEFLYLVKEKRNVKTMAAGRVSPRRQLLAGYRQIVAPRDESIRFRNPVFRRGLLIALLDGKQWYIPLGKMLATFDAELFIRQPRGSPDPEGKGIPQFANDAAKKFRQEAELFTQTLERMKTMPDAERPKASLPVIVNRVVRSYMLIRTKDKTGIDPDKFKTADGDIDYKQVPSEFNETKQRIAQSLFLEFRSRQDQAFVEHFAATFFSVTQRLVEADRLELAELLMNPDHCERLKTLTLLSLSANS